MIELPECAALAFSVNRPGNPCSVRRVKVCGESNDRRDLQ